MRANAFALEDTWSEELPSDGLRWKGASAEQLEFMQRVYDSHVSHASARRTFLLEVPDAELDHVEGVRLRTAAASDCRAMFAAARADLEAQQAAGSAAARRVRWIGVLSGYRSATEQFSIWQRRFPSYYANTAEKRATADGGEHGHAAAELLRKYVSSRVAAPGYSLHNDGRAVDVKTSERDVVFGANGNQKTPWRLTWLWDWLVANAGRFTFFQNEAIEEPWHWEHHPARRTPESVDESVVPAGEKIVDKVPLLASHEGSAPDLYLRWNDLASTDEIDVAVHFHGFSGRGAKMNIVDDKVPISGLDWRDPANAASGVGRSRPTLFILPRGNHDPTRGKGAGYTFPALRTALALQELCTFALEQFAAQTGRTDPPRIARLILTAHSGGGEALERLLSHVDPQEIHLFDALYHPVPNVVKWMKRHVAADDDAAAGAQPGALRVFYRERTLTEAFSKEVARAIGHAIHGRRNAQELARRYRVEAAAMGHNDVPRRYGWQVFADAAADMH